MEQIRKKLSGVFAPVVTPFRGDELALDDLRFNLRKFQQTALTGYLALGSNGEAKSLSDKEQLRVLEVFAEEKGDKVVMVGTGCESTRRTVEKSRMASEMGFDYVIILTPSYFAKQIDGAVLADYYTQIAEETDIPKDSSPTGPGKFLACLDPAEDFHVLAGSANFFYPALHLGAAGGVLSLANVLPGPCCDLYELFVQGRFDQARELHFRLARLNQAISGVWGVAGVKAAMNAAGFKGGQPRHPLKAVADEDIQRIKDKMVAEGFLSS